MEALKARHEIQINPINTAHHISGDDG